MATKRVLFGALLIASGFLFPGRASAHCDGMDGPVVQAAQKALETGNVNLVLIWVQAQDEAAIKTAFQKTLEVRKLGAVAKALADESFFETLVRVHRAGEGAPFTGLKPAGRDLGPAIPAADKALENGSLRPLMDLLTKEVRDGLEEHFKEALETKSFKSDDVAAGRKFVRAYVEFLHFAERVHQAATKAAHGHFDEKPQGKTPSEHEE